MTVTLADPFDDSISYEILKYATVIKENSFTENYSGMRGSALLIQGINELKLVKNIFENNKPSTTFSEVNVSPYYKFFALS